MGGFDALKFLHCFVTARRRRASGPVKCAPVVQLSSNFDFGNLTELRTTAE